MARAAAANDPTVLLAPPVNGALPPALPVPMGADGLIGEPVAPGPDPAPPDEPVPVGLGAPVPVANPVDPATTDELDVIELALKSTQVRRDAHLTAVVLVHEQSTS